MFLQHETLIILAPQQLVGLERRERVSYQIWRGEGFVNSRRPVNSDVMRLVLISLLLISMARANSAHELVPCEGFGTEERNIESQAITKVPAKYPNEPGMRVKGTVIVHVHIDRRGNVTSARAICGHPLLVAGSVAAALHWKFRPFRLAGRRYKTAGIISFHFATPEASSYRRAYNNSFQVSAG